MRVIKIISGGQTGVDQAGLRAARSQGIATGGAAPEGYWTEAGCDLGLISYGLYECAKWSYYARTAENVAMSDATLILARIPNSAGSTLTMKLARHGDKPQMYLSGASASWNLSAAIAWLERTEAKKWGGVLNVAGNRESIAPGIGAEAEAFIGLLLSANAGQADAS